MATKAVQFYSTKSSMLSKQQYHSVGGDGMATERYVVG